MALRRPIAATRRGVKSAAEIAPRAMAVPCRPPAAFETPRSSASSGTDGLKEYRNHPQTAKVPYVVIVYRSRRSGAAMVWGLLTAP